MSAALETEHHSCPVQDGSARRPPLPFKSPQRSVHDDKTTTLPQQSPSISLSARQQSQFSSSTTFATAPAASKMSKSNENNSGGSPSSTSSETQRYTQRLVKQYRIPVAASVSSVISTVSTFPLDSVKTRMQTYKYDGFLHCVRQTYETEKVRGFFRGVTAPMASITLVRTVSFSIYQRAKYIYSDWINANFGVDVMAQVAARGSYPTFWSVATFGLAGATAGSCITVIACPFELTKLCSQVSVLMADEKNCPRPERKAVAASYQNKGTIKTLRNIVRHRGYRGLYTGFGLHLMRDTLGTGIYFMTYESSKQLLTTFGGDGTHSNPLAVLVAGALCGIVSWALIYPVDVAKSNYQRNSLTYSRGEKVEPVKIQWFRRNMYRGLGVSMARSCAVNAVFFSSFEVLKKRIKAMEVEDLK